jgi:hypothetical protein
MSQSATNMNGRMIIPGDQCTIHGACTSITGTSPSVKEAVTFTSLFGDLVTVQAGDLQTAEHQPIAPYYGRTTTHGDPFKAADEATINGVVQSVTNGPWGFTGVLTVLTDFSGTLITVCSGSVDSHG